MLLVVTDIPGWEQAQSATWFSLGVPTRWNAGMKPLNVVPNCFTPHFFEVPSGNLNHSYWTFIVIIVELNYPFVTCWFSIAMLVYQRVINHGSMEIPEANGDSTEDPPAPSGRRARSSGSGESHGSSAGEGGPPPWPCSGEFNIESFQHPNWNMFTYVYPQHSYAMGNQRTK